MAARPPVPAGEGCGVALLPLRCDNAHSLRCSGGQQQQHVLPSSAAAAATLVLLDAVLRKYAAGSISASRVLLTLLCGVPAAAVPLLTEEKEEEQQQQQPRGVLPVRSSTNTQQAASSAAAPALGKGGKKTRVVNSLTSPAASDVGQTNSSSNWWPGHAPAGVQRTWKRLLSAHVTQAAEAILLVLRHRVLLQQHVAAATGAAATPEQQTPQPEEQRQQQQKRQFGSGGSARETADEGGEQADRDAEEEASLSAEEKQQEGGDLASSRESSLYVALLAADIWLQIVNGAVVGPWLQRLDVAESSGAPSRDSSGMSGNSSSRSRRRTRNYLELDSEGLRNSSSSSIGVTGSGGSRAAARRRRKKRRLDSRAAGATEDVLVVEEEEELAVADVSDADAAVATAPAEEDAAARGEEGRTCEGEADREDEEDKTEAVGLLPRGAGSLPHMQSASGSLEWGGAAAAATLLQQRGSRGVTTAAAAAAAEQRLGAAARLMQMLLHALCTALRRCAVLPRVDPTATDSTTTTDRQPSLQPPLLSTRMLALKVLRLYAATPVLAAASTAEYLARLSYDFPAASAAAAAAAPHRLLHSDAAAAGVCNRSASACAPAAVAADRLLSTAPVLKHVLSAAVAALAQYLQEEAARLPPAAAGQQQASPAQLLAAEALHYVLHADGSFAPRCGAALAAAAPLLQQQALALALHAQPTAASYGRTLLCRLTWICRDFSSLTRAPESNSYGSSEGQQMKTDSSAAASGRGEKKRRGFASAAGAALSFDGLLQQVAQLCVEFETLRMDEEAAANEDASLRPSAAAAASGTAAALSCASKSEQQSSLAKHVVRFLELLAELLLYGSGSAMPKEAALGAGLQSFAQEGGGRWLQLNVGAVLLVLERVSSSALASLQQKLTAAISADTRAAALREGDAWHGAGVAAAAAEAVAAVGAAVATAGRAAAQAGEGTAATAGKRKQRAAGAAVRCDRQGAAATGEGRGGKGQGRQLRSGAAGDSAATSVAGNWRLLSQRRGKAAGSNNEENPSGYAREGGGKEESRRSSSSRFGTLVDAVLQQVADAERAAADGREDNSKRNVATVAAAIVDEAQEFFGAEEILEAVLGCAAAVLQVVGSGGLLAAAARVRAFAHALLQPACNSPPLAFLLAARYGGLLLQWLSLCFSIAPSCCSCLYPYVLGWARGLLAALGLASSASRDSPWSFPAATASTASHADSDQQAAAAAFFTGRSAAVDNAAAAAAAGACSSDVVLSPAFSVACCCRTLRSPYLLLRGPAEAVSVSPASDSNAAEEGEESRHVELILFVWKTLCSLLTLLLSGASYLFSAVEACSVRGLLDGVALQVLLPVVHPVGIPVDVSPGTPLPLLVARDCSSITAAVRLLVSTFGSGLTSLRESTVRTAVWVARRLTKTVEGFGRGVFSSLTPAPASSLPASFSGAAATAATSVDASGVHELLQTLDRLENTMRFALSSGRIFGGLYDVSGAEDGLSDSAGGARRVVLDSEALLSGRVSVEDSSTCGTTTCVSLVELYDDVLKTRVATAAVAAADTIADATSAAVAAEVARAAAAYISIAEAAAADEKGEEEEEEAAAAGTRRLAAGGKVTAADKSDSGKDKSFSLAVARTRAEKRSRSIATPGNHIPAASGNTVDASGRGSSSSTGDSTVLIQSFMERSDVPADTAESKREGTQPNKTGKTQAIVEAIRRTGNAGGLAAAGQDTDVEKVSSWRREASVVEKNEEEEEGEEEEKEGETDEEGDFGRRCKAGESEGTCEVVDEVYMKPEKGKGSGTVGGGSNATDRNGVAGEETDAVVDRATEQDTDEEDGDEEKEGDEEDAVEREAEDEEKQQDERRPGLQNATTGNAARVLGDEAAEMGRRHTKRGALRAAGDLDMLLQHLHVVGEEADSSSDEFGPI